MKASTKLYFGTVMQFLVAISLVAVFFYMLEKQEHDSVVINLAGRQRMLSQKMTKETLLFSQGVFPAEKILDTIDMFDQTLKALTYGGKAPFDLVQTTFTTLPAPETRAVITQLKTVESIWSLFSKIAKKYLKEKKASSLAYLKDNNVLLLQEMDRAVFLMDEDAVGKVASLRKVLLLGSAVLSLLFVLILFITKRAEAERERLLESERQRADELDALRTTITDIASELELSKLLHAIVERAAGLLDATGGELGLYEETSREIQIVVNHNLGRGYIGTRLRIGEGAMGRVAKTGEPLIIEDYHVWEGRARQYDKMVIHACLAAPLKVGNRLVGIMTIATTDPDRQFGSADVHLITLFAHQAAIAIENAHLFAEVQNQKRYSESLVQNSPVAIVSVDMDGNVSSWNPAAERLFGFTQAEAVGCNLDVLITTTPKMLEEAKDFTREMKGKTSLFHAITRRGRRDGTPVEVEVLAAPVDVKDPYAGSLAIYHDITELKGTQQELQKAKEAAEAANRAKSTFLTNMSHELRTPLNAVIGYSEMLIEDAEEQGQEAFIPDLQKIREASKQLLSLINDVLDLSKIEAGKMEFYLETFEIMHLIQDVVSTVQPLVEKNANNLIIHSADDLSTMHTDLSKVRQGLVNLLGNASKFTEHGTIRLDAARQTVDGTDWITFSVSDTGIGMTPEQMEKLFQPFSQAEASLTRKYGGTGLGLEITRRFCKMLGGDITVKSKLGVGSTFTIRLPADVVQPNIEKITNS